MHSVVCEVTTCGHGMRHERDPPEAIVCVGALLALATTALTFTLFLVISPPQVRGVHQRARLPGAQGDHHPVQQRAGRRRAGEPAAGLGCCCSLNWVAFRFGLAGELAAGLRDKACTCWFLLALWGCCCRSVSCNVFLMRSRVWESWLRTSCPPRPCLTQSVLPIPPLPFPRLFRWWLCWIAGAAPPWA